MKSLGFGRQVLCSCVAGAMLAGCGGSQPEPPVGANAPTSQRSAFARSGYLEPASSSFEVLRRFGRPGRRHHDAGGVTPDAPLIDVNGRLYGTTTYGGRKCPHPGYEDGHEGCGTVFSISPSGAWKLLYSFRGGSADGAHPFAGLIDVNGTLYGTASAGGGTGCYDRVGCGVVYSISTSGAEKLLYSFAGGSDGAYPVAALINVNGTLYGTTLLGGGSTECGTSEGCGTVYSITTSGTEKMLYAFGSASGADPANPEGALLDVNGALYGTTTGGGNHRCKGVTYACGTVYSITTSGTEKTLYSFKGGSDGASPSSNLIDVNGMLYGTTFGGSIASGTAYRISTSGAEKVLHVFQSGSTDGWWPSGALIDVKGALYGTTQHGGTSCGSSGCGTIFSITRAGNERVLYSFTGAPNSSVPAAALLDLKGTFYGTSMGGGNCGYERCGTVFAFKP